MDAHPTRSYSEIPGYSLWGWALTGSYVGLVPSEVQSKLHTWYHKDLPLAGKLTVVGRILQASHIYYASCWFPSRTQFRRLEQVLRSYLWAKFGGLKGLPMVPWDVCTIPKEEGGLGLIDVATQGSILAAKWVVKCLEGGAPWQVMFRHG